MNEPTKARMVMPPTAFIRLENGVPFPLYTQKPNAQLVTDLFFSAIADEYKPLTHPNGDLLPGEEEFVGWTNNEVATLRRVRMAAHGDLDSHKLTLDRTLGKPTQQITQTIENVTLSKALDTIGASLKDKYPHLYPPRLTDNTPDTHVIDRTDHIIDVAITLSLQDVW